MRGVSVSLCREMRVWVERQIPTICERGGWDLWISAAGADHVHVLLSARVDGKAVRRWLKTWLGQWLTQAWGEPKSGRWWAKGGSVKPVWTQAYFERVYYYIQRQRTLAS